MDPQNDIDSRKAVNDALFPEKNWNLNPGKSLTIYTNECFLIPFGFLSRVPDDY